ncbi:c-type cytochrome [Deferribacter autotrophicus]|uniref:C-type cytochrome n=1 Tax=Deferribacter autotrophicus TaxID=500465 RepID=A0A5A8F5Q9_9BACT|nr:cytochrome c peroxidase [Deferribacter autotrophicus]KAA0259387.1 c-type cytochrome [Deferribacter autotrophicus]
MKECNLRIIFFVLSLVFLSFNLCAARLITPIPQKIEYNEAKALLGKKLFYEKMLSKDKKISCASCHDLYSGGTDHRKFSIGVFNRVHSINSPTVYNAIFNFRQNWNGSAKDLKEQAAMAIKGFSEMDMTEKEVEDRLNKSSKYRELFYKVYGINEIKFSYVIDAIAEFEKALITPNCKFDKYLRGEIELTEDEKDGFSLFKSLGCITCHNGVNLGGNSYQKIGIIFPHKWSEKVPDLYQITKDPEDKNVFKVPTLRNIEITYPYFHDGSAKTLKEAVEKMALHNLGLELNKEEMKKILMFLKTLTGELPDIIKENKEK